MFFRMGNAHSRLLTGVALAAFLSMTSLARADLAHRYSFNDGTPNDSVGTAHGTVLGGASITSGALSTASGGLVTLPNAATAGITGDFSIEQWFTWNGGGGPQINFSFGDDIGNYVLSHPSFNQGFTVEYIPGPGTLFRAPPATGAATYLCTTYSSSTQTYAMYVNGSLINSLTGPAFNLATTAAGRSDIGGRGPFSDPSLNGSTDEFRIWNSALTAVEISQHFALGPNVVPAPSVAALLGLGGLMAVRRRR